MKTNTLISELILTKKPKYIHATRIEQAINICPVIITGQPKLLTLAWVSIRNVPFILLGSTHVLLRSSSPANSIGRAKIDFTDRFNDQFIAPDLIKLSET